MKIIALSLDPKVLDSQSVAASRNVRYGEVLEAYSILVPVAQAQTVALSAKTKVYGTGGSSKIAQLLRLYGKAKQLIEAGQCDVITSQDTYFLALVGYLLAKKYHLGLEVQVLGIEKLSFWRKKLSQFTLTRASSIRVLSKGLQKRLVEEFGISTERMKLVPIYVDVSSLGLNTAGGPEVQHHIDAFKQAYGDRFNFVSVNRLVPVKNISLQLRAIHALKETHPEVLLHIVGDGPLRESLEKEVKSLGISDHVILHGSVFGSALNPFFTQTDCFILTSHSEGWGMVVIEAATASLPVIMTDVGCAGEVIQNGVNGTVIADNDQRGLVDAMKIMVSDQSLRLQYGTASHNTVLSLPNFDEVLEKYVASWQQALENKL